MHHRIQLRLNDTYRMQLYHKPASRRTLAGWISAAASARQRYRHQHRRLQQLMLLNAGNVVQLTSSNIPLATDGNNVITTQAINNTCHCYLHILPIELTFILTLLLLRHRSLVVVLLLWPDYAGYASADIECQL